MFMKIKGLGLGCVLSKVETWWFSCYVYYSLCTDFHLLVHIVVLELVINL